MEIENLKKSYESPDGDRISAEEWQEHHDQALASLPSDWDKVEDDDAGALYFLDTDGEKRTAAEWRQHQEGILAWGETCSKNKNR